MRRKKVCSVQATGRIVASFHTRGTSDALCLTHHRSVLKLPKMIKPEVAVTLPVSYGTALMGLQRRAALKEGYVWTADWRWRRATKERGTLCAWPGPLNSCTGTRAQLKQLTGYRVCKEPIRLGADIGYSGHFFLLVQGDRARDCGRRRCWAGGCGHRQAHVQVHGMCSRDPPSLLYSVCVCTHVRDVLHLGAECMGEYVHRSSFATCADPLDERIVAISYEQPTPYEDNRGRPLCR